MRTRLVSRGLAALLLLPLAGCLAVATVGGVPGSGVAKTESRDVKDFTAVSLSGVGKVTIKQTGKESLSITADDNLLPMLESVVEGGTLKLRTASNTSISPKTPIAYVIEVKDLAGVTMSGAGDITATDLDGKALTVTLTGAGDVTLSGKADELTVTLSGTGSFKGEGLSVKRAKVRASGVGDATVNASEQLDAGLSGVGSVTYVGSPQEVKSTVTGVGKIKQKK